MNIYLNNKITEIPDNCDIASLLLRINITETKGIAVAVNNQIINKSEWVKYNINENDNVLIVTASQGG